MKRAPWIVACGFVGTVLAVTSAAWACSPAAFSPYLAEPNPKEAPATSQVLVTGGNWTARTSVELRWDSETGPLLATAPVLDDRTFSVTVTIPKAEPGVHYLVALHPSTAPVSTTFGVAAPGAVQSNPDANRPPPNRHEGPTSGDVTSQEVSGGTGVPSPHPTGPPSFSPSPAPVGPPAGSQMVGAPNSQRSPAAPSDPAFADAPAPPVAAPVTNGQDLGNQPLATGPVPTASGPTAATPNEALAPSALSSGDLWSGFPSSEAGQQGSSLLDLPSSKLPGAPTSPVTLAVGLLTSSLVALSVGFGLAELFRRKVRVDG